MKSRRKTGVRVLALLLALVLGMTSLGTETSVYASAPAVHSEEIVENFQREEEENSALETEPGMDSNEEPGKDPEGEPGTAPQKGADAELHTEEKGESEDTEEKQEITAAGTGDGIKFVFERETYFPGDTVTVILTPEDGFDLDMESIAVTDAQGTETEYELTGPDENRAVTLKFQAAETDMTVKAEAEPWPRYAVTVTTETLEEGTSVFQTSVEPEDFYEGIDVTVNVDYSGDQIWAAAVTYGEEDQDLDFFVSPSGVSFIMPGADVEVVLSERESQNLGDLSAEDDSIAGDWQGSSSSTTKEYEPDVELSKSARWTDIEDGYAELTITEKDTSDYANIPVDYIIILDRTRTMSLSNLTWEQGGYPDIVNENSPCINPNHYYYKGGISLNLVDYYTGFDRLNGVWFDNLSGGAGSWTKRHYNSSGQSISVNYGNGCQDRLTMAKQAVNELVDRIAEDNAEVPA